jgi:serine/threonine-protein phosphatase 2A activator
MTLKLAELRQIPLTEVPALATPTLKIQTDDDVEIWKHSRSYQDYAVFLRRLNESVVGRDIPEAGIPTSKV